jgi:thermostable 8-oxoguanine DNA glycosylase
MDITQAENFFNSVRQSTVRRYTDYWESIKPITQNDFLRRYLFAFTSVHTTWLGNIRGYTAIRDLKWLDSKETLLQRLINAKCGMHNHRTEYIWNFKEQFLKNPEKYCQKVQEWQPYRNQLVGEINGIGMAKVSFTLEMNFPNEAEVTCLDTHGVQLYKLSKNGAKSKKEVIEYETAEKHWVDCSKAVGCSPTVARAIMWDKKQNKRNSRYWTYVL